MIKLESELDSVSVFADDEVNRERGSDKEDEKVSKKHLPNEDSEPSANISPLKRTRIS